MLDHNEVALQRPVPNEVSPSSTCGHVLSIVRSVSTQKLAVVEPRIDLDVSGVLPCLWSGLEASPSVHEQTQNLVVYININQPALEHTIRLPGHKIHILSTYFLSTLVENGTLAKHVY